MGRDTASVKFREPFPILYVADVERSARFYAEILGFEPTFQWRNDGCVEYAYLGLGATGIGLARRDASTGLNEMPAGQAAAPGCEICLLVDDVDAASDHLRDHGVQELMPARDMPWGERMAYFADPDGYLLHIRSRAE